MINTQHLLGTMVRAALSSNRRGHRSYRRRSSGLAGDAGAAIGMGLLGLAIGAWDHYSKQQSAAAGTGGMHSGGYEGPPPVSSGPPPVPGRQSAPPPLPQQAGAQQDDSKDALVLVRAMVAAAHADWLIDAEERARIMGELSNADLSADEKKFLEQEIDRPIALDDLIAQVKTPQLAEQVYVASMLAINVDSDAERGYLKQLGARLKLSQAKLDELHSQFVSE